MIIVLRVNAPMRLAQGFKEAIAMDLEKYGCVKVLEVREDKPAEQMRIGDKCK
ncbi:MAG: hypothetical protein IJY96_05090 [Oscillospiraceae bacterium]|nr:hypothetical protein [Oscillospiraceae bacterium]